VSDIRARVFARLDAGVAVVVSIGGAVGAIGMAVGLLRFAGRTHFGCWLWMWMKEGWRSGTSGYLKSGSLSPGESRSAGQNSSASPMNDESAGPRADRCLWPVGGQRWPVGNDAIG